MNCWKEAVVAGLQLQCFMLLLLRSDSDSGAESGRVSCLSIDVLFLSTFRRRFLGHDGFQMFRGGRRVPGVCSRREGSVKHEFLQAE